jgi:glycosyltransferase involved in cell wall biosynthesis
MPYPRATQVARLAAHVRYRPLKIFCLNPEGADLLRGTQSPYGIDLVRMPRTAPTRMLERLFESRRHRTLGEYDLKYFWWRGAARLIIREQPTSEDVLVTFGQPMVDHLAGLTIKQRTGVRWIAHFSDPWVDNPFDPKARDWRTSEEAVLQAADLTIFTSQETVDLVYAKYPVGWRAKAQVLPHAYDASLYPKDSSENDRLTVRYLGNFFEGRGPEPLLQALTILRDRSPDVIDRTRFEFIGDAPPSFRNHPLVTQLGPECVQFLPRVDYRQSLALAKASDLLLNVDAPADISVFLPSKLVDYVGAGKPIFGITPPGTASRLIRDLGGWVANPTDPSEIAGQLACALAYVERHRNASWGNAEIKARYEASTVARRFEQLVEELAEH